MLTEPELVVPMVVFAPPVELMPIAPVAVTPPESVAKPVTFTVDAFTVDAFTVDVLILAPDVKFPSTDTAPDTLRPPFKVARAFTSKPLRVVFPSTFNVVLTEVFCRTVCNATMRVPLTDALPVSNFRDRRSPIMLTLPPILTLLITDKLVVDTFTMVVSPATLSVPLMEVF
jgi:hypothetical protein